ncbi:autophagy-related protein Atg28 [Aspergillus granulosus]|uniref:Autophagy-related protein Atg28 n=1 Tax=Aspergillus granulosus TaxID=176169 RepID=A0ABR4HFP4_9EURO
MNQSLVPLPLRASRYPQDPMTLIERQAKNIQRNLQQLIDAQSEGLLAGLGGKQLEGSVSNESHVSFSEYPSSRGASTVSPRQLPAKKIGLRAAREGIFMSMYDLLRLREEEQELLSFRLKERDHGLHEIEMFNTKRSGLESSISAINENRDSQRSRELRDESFKLETEIHELENKLSQMRARHRHVAQELSQIENSIESKLSSYKESLSLLDSDIRRFLKNPPVKPSEQRTDKESFYTLKSSRRTLEMAQEHWKREQFELRHRQKEVTAEIEALDEGGGLWKEVVKDISGFEKRLKATMCQSIQSQSQLLQPDVASSSNAESEMIRGIMKDLSRTTDLVEQHLDYAEERGWKLLVCCISAELEALREARDLLLGVFNVSEDDIWPSQETKFDGNGKDTNQDPPSDPLAVDDSEPPADLLRDVRSDSREAALKSEDDEDDEPDPAWLLPES